MGTLINDCDKCFIDSIAQEVNRLAGTEVNIFQLNEGATAKNPYYNEATDNVYRGEPKGVVCPVFVRSPERSPISGEEGFQVEKRIQASVAKADLDSRNLRRPRIGDIWKIWGLFYQVTDSSATEGRFSDTGETSKYDVDLVRRTKALPEGIEM